ncbi:methyltransferase, TIGR04325 family [Insolitispirillum peregrinum]|uniref:methyltransferase, TIGR04325 family n=1 Tax=Insolitispirillum peregrinum TaxID=80876 RepID=UPI00361B9021
MASFPTWKDAADHSTSYTTDTKLYLGKFFYPKLNHVSSCPPDWVVATAISLACRGKENNAPVSILDFGGGVGVRFLEMRTLLANLGIPKLWRVVELPDLVARMNEIDLPEGLVFETELPPVGASDVVIVDGVLQCIENTYDALDALLKLSAKYVVVRRTPLVASETEIFIVQRNSIKNDGTMVPLVIAKKSRFEEIIASNGYAITSSFDQGHGDSKYFSDFQYMTYFLAKDHEGCEPAA